MAREVFVQHEQAVELDTFDPPLVDIGEVASQAALGGAQATPAAFAAAVAQELADAAPQPGNEFKVELAIRTATAVLAELSGSAS